MKRILFTLLLSYAFIQTAYSDCDGHPADFTYTIYNNFVVFAPCNSAGVGHWDFGDGNTMSFVQGASNCYIEAGTYTVTHEFPINQTPPSIFQIHCPLTRRPCRRGPPKWASYTERSPPPSSCRSAGLAGNPPSARRLPSAHFP